MYDKLLKRVDDEIKKKKLAAVDDFKKKIQSIEDEAACDGWSAAVSEYGAECKPGLCTVLPPVVRYATCISPKYGNVKLPMYLPTDKALLFDVEQRETEIPNVMQRIMLRLLVCMRPGLLKVTAVDRDFGSDFPLIGQLRSQIRNEAVHSQINVLSKDSEILELMNRLADDVKIAYSSMSANNIDEHNARQTVTYRPYHLVLIDDFPNGFSQQALSLLYELIRNNNARRAGILIIINASRGSSSHIMPDTNNVTLSGNGYMNYSLASDDKKEYSSTKWENYIANPQTARSTLNLDGWIENLKTNKRVWSDTSIDGIKVPIGFTKTGGIFDFYIAGDTDPQCNDFFALLTGAPNMGKSSLLHNLIINASLKYSPKELVFYLIDFSNGATFNIYRKLPHAKALMLANNKEYAIRVLDEIEQECEHRARLYEETTADSGKIINKLSDYRIATGKILPRILLVIDEFQVLFQSHDTFTESAREKLCNGIRQWRKFGVSVVLSTQSLSGVNFGEGTQSNITYRFAMRQSQENSKLTLRNGAAAYLTKPGQTIMNNSFDGNESKNVEFQCSWSDKHGEQVRYLADLYTQKFGDAPVQYVCDSSPISDMSSNPFLVNLLGNKNKDTLNAYDIFVGKPDLLRNGHTRVRLKRQRGSNIMVIGDDNNTSVRLIASILMQFCLQSPEKSNFIIADCFNPGDDFYGAFDGLNGIIDGVKVVHGTETADAIGCAWDVFQRRKNAADRGEFEKEPFVMAIVNTQDSSSLHPVDNGRFSEPSKTSQQLVELLREGPQLGVHCIIHSCSALALTDSNNGIGLKNSSQLFTNIILLRGADSDNLWDVGRVPSIETFGRGVVLNGRLDKERYEQCLIYNLCTIPAIQKNVQHIIDIYLTRKESKK